MFKTLLCGASLLALATAAHAQTAAQTVTQTSTQTETLGQKLYDRGVSISLNYTGEAAGNPYGGIRQGTQYTGQLYLGGDFDMGKIVGLEGMTIHIAVTQRHGRNLAQDDIGNNTSVQEVWGTQNLHLANFSIEQKLFGGRLDVNFGRVASNITFFSSPLYCQFQSNSACGNPTFIFKDANFTYFPASAWGGDAKFLFTPNTYVHGGVYEVSPIDKTFVDHGFNFGGKGDTGVVMPVEFGYTPAGGLYAIGAWYDTGAYSDPLNDANGQPALPANQPYAQHHDRSGFFLRFNQQVTPGGLSIFGVFMTKVTGSVAEDRYYELGAVQQGIPWGRPNDTAGFVVNDQEFSRAFVQNIADARESVGGSGWGIPHREIMMELNYDARIGKAFTITPNLQYILNPDQSAEPYRKTNIPDAFVLGVKFTVDLAELGGFAAPQ